MLLDDYFRLYRGLEKPPYNWSWNQPKGALSYEWCEEHGSDCSRSIDVTCVKLGLADPGNTVEIANTLFSRMPYPRAYAGDVWFLRGTVLVNPTIRIIDGRAQDRSHVAICSDAKNQTVAHCRHYPAPSGVYMDDNLKWVDSIYQFQWTGYLSSLGVDYNPLAGFCGHFSPPSLLAIWMATVAHVRYQLPEVLPVMCSMQELGDAWVTGRPLPSYAVHGYHGDVKAAGYDSLGFFQRRPSVGRWGTIEEVLDPNHALKAFCEEAVNHRRNNLDETDPVQLSNWIADVQRSRGHLRHEYAKHYKNAINLIEEGRALLPKKYRYNSAFSRTPSSAL